MLNNNATAEANEIVVEDGGLAGGGAFDLLSETQSFTIESRRNERRAVTETN